MKLFLSIDGGGIKGIIPATVLTEIEQKSGVAIAKAFSLIAGTSTGGILTLGLASPNRNNPNVPIMTAEQMLKIYEKDGKKIFKQNGISKGYTMSKYSNESLFEYISDIFGDTLLDSVLSNVFIPSYNISKAYITHFNQKNNSRVRLIDIIMATTAAPTFFKPWEINGDCYIDGGVFCNNPSMSSIAFYLPKFGLDIDYRFLSLGTGLDTKPLICKKANSWGKAGWFPNLLHIIASASSEDIDNMMFNMINGKYYRIQSSHGGHMDDLTEKGIHKLKSEGLRVVRESFRDIGEFASIIKSGDYEKLPVITD